MTAAFDPPATRGIEAPRAPRRRVAGRRSNFEMYSWMFMRLSGIVLVVLVLGHLLIMNVLDGGVHRINWGFVAGRWASPFWQVWDLIMLWLAEIHGANGLRIDHQRLRPQGRHPVLAAADARRLGRADPRCRHPGDLHLRSEHELTGARRMFVSPAKPVSPSWEGLTCSSTVMTW